MDKQEILKTEKWLDYAEIEKNLEGVEYILMAAPTPGQNVGTPIHFSIYLNTKEPLPGEVWEQVFEKFCKDYGITRVSDMIRGVLPVAFSLNNRDTAMPMLLSDESAKGSALHYTQMYVFDFEGEAKGFKECKRESKTGWTYAYSDDD